MYDHYFKKFEKLIEPNIIDYDGKDIINKKDKQNLQIQNNNNKNQHSQTFNQSAMQLQDPSSVIRTKDDIKNMLNNNNFNNYLNNPNQTSNNLNINVSNLNNLSNNQNQKTIPSRPASSVIKSSNKSENLTDYIKVENEKEENQTNFNSNLTSYKNINDAKFPITTGFSEKESKYNFSGKNIQNLTMTEEYHNTRTPNNELHNQSRTVGFNTTSKSKYQNVSNINDVEVLKSIIKAEKTKNMNLRYEIQELKKEILKNEASLKLQDDSIIKLEKLREGDKRYIEKMEKMLKNSHEVKSINAEYKTFQVVNENKVISGENEQVKEESNFNENSNTNSKERIIGSGKKLEQRYYYIEHPSEIFTFGREKFSVNINDKFQIKSQLESFASKIEFFEELYENIYNISTNKEDLNTSLHNLWKRIAAFFNLIETPNDFELYNIREVLDDFSYVNRNMNEMLDQKHKEYLYLLKKKQEQCSSAEVEAQRLRDELTSLKLDRGVDLKLQNKLETENELLSAKMKEIENAVLTPRKRKDLDYKQIYELVTKDIYSPENQEESEKDLKKVQFSQTVRSGFSSQKGSQTNLRQAADKKWNQNFSCYSSLGKHNSSNNDILNTDNFKNIGKLDTKGKLSINQPESRKRKQEQEKNRIIKKSFDKIETSLDVDDSSNKEFINKLNLHLNKK